MTSVLVAQVSNSRHELLFVNYLKQILCIHGVFVILTLVSFLTYYFFITYRYTFQFM